MRHALLAFTATLFFASSAAHAAALDDLTLTTVPNGCAKDQAGYRLRNTTKDRPIRATILVTTSRPSGQSERTVVADVNPGEIKSVGCASDVPDMTLEFRIAGAFYLDLLRPEDRKPS